MHAFADFILPDDDFTGFCGQGIEQFEQLDHFLVVELPEKDGFLKLPKMERSFGNIWILTVVTLGDLTVIRCLQCQ